MIKLALTMFFLGLSFGAGPCIASCGPLLISYIVGERRGIKRGLGVYTLFSFSRIAVYILLGIAVFLFGRFIFEEWLARFSKLILLFGGGFIASLGLATVLGKGIENNFCRFIDRHILEKDGKNIVLLGISSGILPCMPLLAAFSYIGLISRSWVSSALYSTMFGLGTFISPLLLLVLLSGLIPRFLRDARPAYQRALSILCGLIMVFLGIQVIGRAF